MSLRVLLRRPSPLPLLSSIRYCYNSQIKGSTTNTNSISLSICRSSRVQELPLNNKLYFEAFAYRNKRYKSNTMSGERQFVIDPFCLSQFNNPDYTGKP